MAQWWRRSLPRGLRSGRGCAPPRAHQLGPPRQAVLFALRDPPPAPPPPPALGPPGRGEGAPGLGACGGLRPRVVLTAVGAPIRGGAQGGRVVVLLAERVGAQVAEGGRRLAAHVTVMPRAHPLPCKRRPLPDTDRRPPSHLPPVQRPAARGLPPPACAHCCPALPACPAARWAPRGAGPCTRLEGPGQAGRRHTRCGLSRRLPANLLCHFPSKRVFVLFCFTNMSAFHSAGLFSLWGLLVFLPGSQFCSPLLRGPEPRGQTHRRAACPGPGRTGGRPWCRTCGRTAPAARRRRSGNTRPPTASSLRLWSGASGLSSWSSCPCPRKTAPRRSGVKGEARPMGKSSRRTPSASGT